MYFFAIVVFQSGVKQMRLWKVTSAVKEAYSLETSTNTEL